MGEEETMKKLLTIAISIVTLSFAAISAEAKTPAASFAPAPQVRIQIGQRHRGRGGRDWNNDRFNHRVRTYTQTIFTRAGRHQFRETYLVTVFPNGRTQMRLISRVRVR
jgi:opacity protein-like surface antigen